MRLFFGAIAMATKRIILIHGRAIKPAEAPMLALARDAVVDGLKRTSATTVADKVQHGTIKFDLAYFGDITNQIQANARKKEKALLTASDADHGNAACFPIDDLRAAFVEMQKVKTFNKTKYDDVLRTAEDWRFLDEAADFSSLIGSLFTFGWLNSVLIKSATPDLSAYLTSYTTASLMRERLTKILVPALEAGDDVCLIAHSMGAIIAYDEFWKYSFRTGYTNSQAKGRPVSLFLTIGCPLGEPGVRVNLLDGKLPNDEDHYPRHQISRWVNVHAEDDYIARAESMRAAFSEMKSKHYLDDIADQHIYNCWNYLDNHTGNRVSNPHDLYGYLMHPAVGKLVANWAG
jgi:hypothetical protein